VRADGLAGRQTQQHIRLSPPGDDGAGTAAGRALGRQHLGDHAAGAHAGAGAAGHLLQGRVAGLGHVDEAGVGVLARIGRVQALLVGQDDQGIGLDQVGHQGAQRVVVAELDLVVDDGVVLVDDRDDPRPSRSAGSSGR
jgi:hypothetical protein